MTECGAVGVSGLGGGGRQLCININFYTASVIADRHGDKYCD